jgi:hypothetical protein
MERLLPAGAVDAQNGMRLRYSIVSLERGGKGLGLSKLRIAADLLS